MPFSATAFMTLLRSARIFVADESKLKEWMENYRPVRQWVVRSETTKGKAASLAPAVYQMPCNGSRRNTNVNAFPEDLMGPSGYSNQPVTSC